MTDQIVVGDRIRLAAGFRAARARLEILAGDEVLRQAAEAAYGTGITHLVAAAGPAAGLTRLAGAYLDQVTGTEACAHGSLRWEAIAADGTLFTALEADLMLVPAGDQNTVLANTVLANTVLALAGGYRPQPGPAGAGLDEAILRRCATVAIRSFVAQVAGTLAHPAGTAGPAIVP
jgi:hypothetical protein